MCDVCIKTCNAIAELTTEEADSLTILCVNPEFSGPNRAIECNGFWTDFQDKRFKGDDLVSCLESAVKARQEYEEVHGNSH